MNNEHTAAKKPIPELDPFLPQYQWWTQHYEYIDVPPEIVRLAFMQLTSTDLRIAGFLFKLRLLPSLLFGSAHTNKTNMAANELVWESMVNLGFIELEGASENTAVLGFIGQPWKFSLSNAIRKDVTGQEFTRFQEPDYIKGVNAVLIKPDGSGTLVITETRVFATSPYAVKKFTPYWTFVKPFSGLMRLDMLASIHRKAKKISAIFGLQSD